MNEIQLTSGVANIEGNQQTQQNQEANILERGQKKFLKKEKY